MEPPSSPPSSTLPSLLTHRTNPPDYFPDHYGGHVQHVPRSRYFKSTKPGSVRLLKELYPPSTSLLAKASQGLVFLIAYGAFCFVMFHEEKGFLTPIVWWSMLTTVGAATTIYSGVNLLVNVYFMALNFFGRLSAEDKFFVDYQTALVSETAWVEPSGRGAGGSAKTEAAGVSTKTSNGGGDKENKVLGSATISTTSASDKGGRDTSQTTPKKPVIIKPFRCAWAPTFIACLCYWFRGHFMHCTIERSCLDLNVPVRGPLLSPHDLWTFPGLIKAVQFSAIGLVQLIRCLFLLVGVVPMTLLSSNPARWMDLLQEEMAPLWQFVDMRPRRELYQSRKTNNIRRHAGPRRVAMYQSRRWQYSSTCRSEKGSCTRAGSLCD